MFWQRWPSGNILGEHVIEFLRKVLNPYTP